MNRSDNMGLTFQQQFYQVPEEVFLVICHNGSPKAILEKPEDDNEALALKNKIMLHNDTYKVITINFDELIINGYHEMLNKWGVK